jgi:hypothetical protein
LVLRSLLLVAILCLLSTRISTLGLLYLLLLLLSQSCLFLLLLLN